MTANTGHLPRLIKEQLGQVYVTVVGLLDRIVLTAILVRIWSAENYVTWSAILAFVGFVSLFEFGFNLYFSNRIATEIERGEKEKATQSLGEANTIFSILSIIAFLMLTGVAWVANPGNVATTPALLASTALLIAATAARIGTIGISALYRAHRDYGRYIRIQAFSDFIRVLAIGLVAISGGDILIAAIASFLVQTIISCVFVIFDTRKRYLNGSIPFTVPRKNRLRDALVMSTAFFGQLIPVILWTSLPILILQEQHAAAAIVAMFALVRTLSNLARTPLQMFGSVIGFECARRTAVDDFDGARAAYDIVARAFAVLGGLSAGLLIAEGQVIIGYWSGMTEGYSLSLMLAACLPMVFVPVSVLTHSVLVASNAPMLPMYGRWIQIVITAICFVAMPIPELGLRLMWALATGEILGYAPIAYYAVDKLFHKGRPIHHIANVIIALASAIIGFLLSKLAFGISEPTSLLTLIIALAIFGTLATIFAYFFAINADMRARLIEMGRQSSGFLTQKP